MATTCGDEGTPLTRVVRATQVDNCFSNRNELVTAVQRYIVEEDYKNDDECNVGKIYGWPMNLWCVSKITNMPAVFINTFTFNGDISGWDVSGVTNMAFMFAIANTFNGDLSSWDVSRVTNTRSMFSNADSLNRNLSPWDTSSVC